MRSPIAKLRRLVGMSLFVVVPLQGACSSASAIEASPPTTSPTQTSEPTQDKPPPPLSPVEGELNGGCAPDGTAGHQLKECADGVRFDVDVPDRCLTGSCGVILDVHGWSMTGPMMSLHSRLSDLAGPRGYIVVHPTAPGDPPSWGKGKSPYSKDFSFDPTVWSFVEATATRFHCDDKKLHATGFSQGAMLAFRVAFDHPDRVASIAPIAGPWGFAEPTPFRDSKPTGEVPKVKVPILYIHGTKDRELKFEGNALVLRDAILSGYGLGVAESLHQAATVRASRYRDANGATLFEFWEHDYATADERTVGGHCVPGPVAPEDGHYIGFSPSERPFRCIDGDQDFDAGVEILRFFEEHPRGS